MPLPHNIMAVDLKHTLIWAVLLAVLCLFGSGCCTINVGGFSTNHFRNDIFLKERTARISEDNKFLVVNVKTEVTHRYLPKGMPRWHTYKDYEFSFPLTSPPASAEKFILDVDIEKDPKLNTHTSSFALNLKYVIVENRYENDKSHPPFLLKHYTIQDRHSSNLFHIKVHPDEVPELYKPFVTYSDHYENNHNNWREELMIPYKREGNRFYIYSAGELHSNHALLERRVYIDMETNISTWLCWAIIMPPALVIDVVTLPFQVAGFLIIASAMSNLGP